MLKHYFKVAIRLIKRNLLFSSINMLGFVLGMTAAFLIYLWIVDELTFDDFHKNKDSVYRAVAEVEKDGQLFQSPSTFVPLAETFRSEFPQVENATCIKYNGKTNLHLEERFIEVVYAYVDSSFFDVFSFPVVAGNPNLLKKDAGQIVLSESAAYKLFGKSSAAIGRELVEDTITYKVAAVVKVPRKSHIQFEALLSLDAYPIPTDWYFSERMHVYIQLKKGVPLSEANRQPMSKVLDDHIGKKGVRLSFQPLSDIHLHTSFKEPDVLNHGKMSQIYLFVVLAVLVLFMGAFNFTTLSTASASRRFKEIGVRKVTGAKRKILIIQFLSESLVQAFLSLILALALAELLLPFFNQFVNKDIALQFDWSTLLFILFGIVGVGCLAGCFPAFYMSSFNPLLAFKGGKATGKKGTFVKVLVCIQFFIAIAMLICTSVMFKQLRYLQDVELGFDRENIIVLESNLWVREMADFKREILRNPYVKNVSKGSDVTNFLRGYNYEESRFFWEDEAGRMDSMKIVGMVGDSAFIETLGLTLLNGRTFGADPKAFRGDVYRDIEAPIVINETAWKMMKVENPVGMLLTIRGWQGGPGRIVGIVKDFNFQPLREKVRPAYLYYAIQALDWIYIKISAENQAETLKFLKEKYEETRPDILFKYQFLTDRLNQNYIREQQQGQMFLIFTLLAIIVAIMGVFGLVALSTAQRTKEIGIRKVNGAHSERIVKMFCREYMIWVGIAFLLACPLSYLFMVYWLESFAYRVAISWWLFPLVGVFILLITFLTVIIQTWRAASRNPVESLRYE